jgi:hypothetical protein
MELALIKQMGEYPVPDDPRAIQILVAEPTWHAFLGDLNRRGEPAFSGFKKNRATVRKRSSRD